MKIPITPDKQKAKALKKMAEITIQRLKETNIEKYPSNTLIDYYDTIHKLAEAISLQKGIKIKGEGAHQELINYLQEENIINETTKIFLQEMREYRNKTQYEGLNIHKNYITQNKKQIEEIIKTLKKITE